MTGSAPIETTLQPSLLAPDEPASWTLERADGASPFFLTCDHASNRIPRALGSLGLPDAERIRHIAWDIGAAETARVLSAELDAALILQNWSRLVIDCNRPPTSADSIATLSERTWIPGNEGLTDAERAQRCEEIFKPYHAEIHRILDHRAQCGRPTLLVALHSFTPVYLGVSRPWHAGILYNRDTRLAHALLAELRRETGLIVGDNEPYTVSDDSDYTIPEHGERRGLAHVEIEIRQDLISTTSGQRAWATRLARALLALVQPLTED